MEFTEEDRDILILALFLNEITAYALPEELYLAIGKYLMKGVREGLAGEIAGEELEAALYENIYLFSAAKTFNYVLESKAVMFDENGHLRTFDEFKIIARDVFDKYNGALTGGEKPGWLEAEYNTAIIQAGNAYKWQQIQANKDVLPYLIYSTVGEGACDICAPMNGICLPVDDKFWDEFAPANHFSCRCVVQQSDGNEGTNSLDGIDLSKVPEYFKYNAGQMQEVFSTTGKSRHPYFDVPDKYKDIASENFGLPIPIPKMKKQKL